MPPRIYRVSELVEEINIRLWRDFGDVSVEGEISNLTRSGAGHIYFTIKDEKAQLRIVLFAMWARQLRFRMENGLKVVVRGKMNVYEARGELQMTANAVDPVGLGTLQLAFEQLKLRLAQEGLFDASRKKAIPMLPQRIAIVTSPQGAAIRDVLNVLGRRFAGLTIHVYPVRVQGATAAQEIAHAVEAIGRWNMHDVVLICRGGGSLEDLWPFNEEVLARAVAGCPIPTISGVGHEVDFTICDFVADLRAPTPSAAAEVVIHAKEEIVARIDNAVRRIRGVVETRVRAYRQEMRHLSSADGIGRFPRRVERMRKSLESRRVSLYRLLERQAKVLRSRLEAANEPLRRLPSRIAIPARRDHLRGLSSRSEQAISGRVQRERARLGAMVTTLEAVSPLSVLGRGYAIAFSGRGSRKRPIIDSAAVSVGEAIEVQLRRGRLECTIDGKTLGVESVWPDVKKG